MYDTLAWPLVFHPPRTNIYIYLGRIVLIPRALKNRKNGTPTGRGQVSMTIEVASQSLPLCVHYIEENIRECNIIGYLEHHIHVICLENERKRERKGGKKGKGWILDPFFSLTKYLKEKFPNRFWNPPPPLLFFSFLGYGKPFHPVKFLKAMSLGPDSDRFIESFDRNDAWEVKFSRFTECKWQALIYVFLSVFAVNLCSWTSCVKGL